MTRAIILLPYLLLAACDSGPKVSATNASIEEVAAKVSDAGGADQYIHPGKWLSKATLEELTAPGMPPEIANNMKLTMANKPGTEQCITKDDVKKPNFTGSQNKNCSYDHFTMGGGKIDARMHCTAGGATQRMTMAGDYGPNEYHLAMTTQMEMPKQVADAGMNSMTMKMRVEGKRIGDCDAGSAKAAAE